MHGLIFFYIRKFAESLPKGLAPTAGPGTGQTSVVRQAGHYLPSGSYPDGDAVALLQAVADAKGEPLGDTVVQCEALAECVAQEEALPVREAEPLTVSEPPLLPSAVPHVTAWPLVSAAYCWPAAVLNRDE